MKRYFFLITAVIAASATPVLAAQCWTQEVNPKTKRIYSSRAEYDAHLRIWNERAKPLPNPLNLIAAYNIYKNEQRNTTRLANDKIKHCYIGCRITQGASAYTTEYVGWYKELQDLTDCRRSSHFENVDFLATVDGSRVAASATSANACATQCTQAWKNY